MTSQSPKNERPPTFREACRFWLKLGFVSFGGPTGQIAILHAELVERKKWISESKFLHALNYCMLLPGPEATQLAVYAGWLLHRVRGGIAAGALWILPSAILLWVLSYAYVAHGGTPWVAAAFYGLKPAVMAIVAASVLRIGSRVLRSAALWGIAMLAFVGIFFLRIPFPLILLFAAAAGLIGAHFFPRTFGAQNVLVQESIPDPEPPSVVSWGRTFRILATGVAMWALPVVLAGMCLGWGHTLAREGLFFSKASLVTFGGAYAVLPYVSQQAVQNYDWLSANQMLDGLGLAETTPGPLIMVLQFVGFLGAWNHPGSLPPLLAATLGAALTTWVTFVPSFIWVFLGAPHIERLHGNRNLNAALTAVTAAVVGVILNLAVWFGMHVLFPAPHIFDIFAATVGVIVFLGIVWGKWGVVPIVLGSALLGVAFRMLF